MLEIELVYAPMSQPVVHQVLMMTSGATVGDAIQQSGIMNAHPEVSDLSVGIFSKQVTYDTSLKAGDRLEIYRPLLIDPKEKRRQRSKK